MNASDVLTACVKCIPIVQAAQHNSFISYDAG